MKTVETWRWSYYDVARRRKVTGKTWCTEAEILADHPNGKPARIEGTMQLREDREPGDSLSFNFDRHAHRP